MYLTAPVCGIDRAARRARGFRQFDADFGSECGHLLINMLSMACHNHVMPTRKVSLGVVVTTGSGEPITIPPTSSSCSRVIDR